MFGFVQADQDGDGRLNYTEFVTFSIHLKIEKDNDEHLHKSFAFFDQNHSGYIEYDDLQAALNDGADTSSDEVIRAMIQDVDTDKVKRWLFACSCRGDYFKNKTV